MLVAIERNGKTEEHVTGVLNVHLDAGVYTCFTLERPWKDNAKYVSCIPDGDYRLLKHVSPKFGKCFIIVNEELGVHRISVSEEVRDNILIHPANWVHQLQGCIAVGNQLMPSKEGLMLYNSRNTLKELLATLPDESTLRISWRC